MARFRIVKVGRDVAPSVEEESRRLKLLGAEVVGAAAPDDEALVNALRGADGVINVGAHFHAAVFDRIDDVWILVHGGTGYDLVDVEAATARGIMVANLPFQCMHEVSNSALAYVLAFSRRVVAADRHVREGRWERYAFMPMGPLAGETLGLLSFGNIARMTARKAQAFEMRVIAHDPFVDPVLAREHGIELVSLEELCRRSDYLSCQAPHNRHTHHLLGEAQFRAMKPTAVFINTSRGKVVDEAALARALGEGWIAGAGLDVFETEPLPDDSPLRQLPNVLLAPHLAGTSDASFVATVQHAIDQMEEALRDGVPSALVNRDVHSRRLVDRR